MATISSLLPCGKALSRKIRASAYFYTFCATEKAFFDDPDTYLKQFVNYYALCLQNFSPLLPDWISLILEEDVRGLQDKMRQLFTESFGVYQNQDLRWILNKHRLPNSETMIHYWKSQAEVLLGDLIHSWYNSQTEIVAGEV